MGNLDDALDKMRFPVLDSGGPQGNDQPGLTNKTSKGRAIAFLFIGVGAAVANGLIIWGFIA